MALPFVHSTCRLLCLTLLLLCALLARAEVLDTQQLAPYWQQQAVFGTFSGVNDVRIAYVKAPVENATASLVLLPGRSEPFIKYLELVKLFNREGYSVFAMDHRGQGLSGRMLEEPLKGHADDFANFSADLHTFMNTVVLPQQEGKLFILAHSMGSAIALRSMAESEFDVAAAVLIAPMIEANLGFAGACFVAELVAWACAECWTPRSQFDSVEAAFAANSVTQSRQRFMAYQNLLQELPQVAVDVPTYGWVRAACRTQDAVMQAASQLSAPLLVLQAEREELVLNEAQNRFCAQKNAIGEHVCKGGAPVVFEGARHEILFEKDEYREEALRLILQHFDAD
ncbi:lysophospholipase [Alteromonadaceae bacterium Bs31]|nr:lysophospholipase [Alteromonadaceae bacterium Bs31]